MVFENEGMVCGSVEIIVRKWGIVCGSGGMVCEIGEIWFESGGLNA